MTIKKYTGKTKEEAIALAKDELGEGIVIMNAKDKKPEGVLGILKKSIWEVTVAIEDDDLTGRRSRVSCNTGFNMAADEPINLDFPDVPGMPSASVNTTPYASRPQSQIPQQVPRTPQSPRIPQATAQSPVTLQQRPQSMQPQLTQPTVGGISEEDLKSAFKEISQVIENAPQSSISSAKTSPDSTIIKREEIEPPVSAKPTQTPVKPVQSAPQNTVKKKKNENNLPLVRMVYNNLIDNEVDEKYINEILDDMGNIISAANSLDYLISNIYQKMVLKLGKPVTIDTSGKGPTVVFFIGPTGVGKTTTIAKIASEYKIEQGKKVAFITSDTYRIAATEQLNVYANILDAPISIIYEPSELEKAVENFRDQDLILVDTVGFSHKNVQQRDNTSQLLNALDPKYKKEVYLVMSVTTKYPDLKEIADTYSEFTDYNLVFTKLDETTNYGNILNIKLYTGAGLSYITNGQNVPDDIDVLDSQKLVKALLGG